jgi:hypothetical protein
MLLKVRVADTASLLKLTERVRKIPGIEQTHDDRLEILIRTINTDS